MANEITVQASLACTNGTFKLPTLGGTQRITQTTAGGGVPGQMTAATGGTDVTLTGLTTPGWAYIKNLDPANYVQIGPKIGGTFYPLIKLKPGIAVCLPLDPAVIPSTTTLHIKANTAAVKCQVVILEE